MNFDYIELLIFLLVLTLCSLPILVLVVFPYLAALITWVERLFFPRRR